jgi:hypothetical protein
MSKTIHASFNGPEANDNVIEGLFLLKRSDSTHVGISVMAIELNIRGEVFISVAPDSARLVDEWFRLLLFLNLLA